MEPFSKDPSNEEEEINISNLPQEASWKNSVNLYKYEDVWYYGHIIKRIVELQKNFIPQPTDIFLATAPKSGTTWLKALVFAIHTRTEYVNGDSPLLCKNPHDIVPSIVKSRDPQNPLIHSHFPFHSTPKSIRNSCSKIIYLWRDPKDVLVSQYHFTSKHRDTDHMIPFEEAYEKFCNGVTSGGPVWDHILGYWKASLEFPDKILFLKYEELKKDTCLYVKKIADFIGCAFSVDEEKQGMVEKIVQLCSFENLSNLEVNKNTTPENPKRRVGNEAFFRKGKVGDWKNSLTPEMAERIDEITLQKFSGSGLH